MAFFIDWTEKLQATRRWLDDGVVQMNIPKNFTRQTGMLNYLFSGINPNIINSIEKTNSNNGEFRDVQIKYRPHTGTGNLVTSDASASCTRVAQHRDKIATVTPDLYAENKFTIDDNYVRDTKDGKGLQDRLNEEIRDSMRIIRESLNQQILAKAAGLFGANPGHHDADGTADPISAGVYEDLPLTIAATGKIDDNNWDIIRNDMEDNFSQGVPAIVGKGLARKYMNRLAVGNINDAGIDYQSVATEFGAILFKDDDVLSSLSAANRTLVFYPGSAQFFQYLLYDGADFAVTDELLIKGTLPDPVLPGISYDYKLKYDDGCSTGNGHDGFWVGRVWTYADLFTIPEEAWGDVYSDLNDFNGIVGYNITES